MRNVIWIIVVATLVLTALALWSPGDSDPATASEPASVPELPPDMDPHAPTAGAAAPQAPETAEPHVVPSDQPPHEPLAHELLAQSPFPNPASPEYGAMLEARFMNDPADDTDALESELTAKVKAVLLPDPPEA